MLTDIAMKDPERHKAPHERNTERELVRELDSQTKVWWVVDKYPWPLAAREMLYVERWVPTDGGDRVVIARNSIELPERPVARGRVRARALVVTELQRIDNGTRMTLCLEFNVGGAIPGRLVDGFLSAQSHTFRNLSRLVASEDGKRRVAEAEQLLHGMVQLQPGSNDLAKRQHQHPQQQHQQQQQQQQQQQRRRRRRPPTVGMPGAARADLMQRPQLFVRSIGSTALVCALVLMCGLQYRSRVWHTRVSMLPGFARAAANLRDAVRLLESVIGPGWIFYIVAVGGGSLLVCDMVLTTLLPNRPAVHVTTSRDARRTQWRMAPAFWQNIQDYRVSYGAPLVDFVEARRVDDNGFQLPVAPVNT